MDIKDIKDAAGKAGFTVLDGQQAEEFIDAFMKEFEERKQKEPPVERYHYESKYQFPEDIDLFGDKDPKTKEGFRNSAHLSVSRGMEFLEHENSKDFKQRQIPGIVGLTNDNINMDKLKDHINDCVIKELGERWGRTGFSMSLAVQCVLQAKELGWEEYIRQVVENQRKDTKK